MNPNVVTRTAVVAIGAVVLVVGSFGAVTAFTSALAPEAVGTEPDPLDPAGRRELDRIHHAQFECIRDALPAAIGSATTAYVPLDPDAPEPDLWKQRLAEMAFPLATVVDEPEPGSIRLTVEADDDGTGCTGVRLVATPVPDEAG